MRTSCNGNSMPDAWSLPGSYFLQLQPGSPGDGGQGNGGESPGAGGENHSQVGARPSARASSARRAPMFFTGRSFCHLPTQETLSLKATPATKRPSRSRR